jgi:hypothetical protein
MVQASATANSATATGTNGVQTWFTAPAFTPVAGRIVRVSSNGMVQSGGAAGDTAALDIMDGAQELASSSTRFQTTGGSSQTMLPNLYITSGFSIAAHILTLRVRQLAGTGVVGAANTSQIAYLIVEDMGTS